MTRLPDHAIFTLLRLLDDGKTHAIEVLTQKLCCSPAVMRELITQLQTTYGVSIDTLANGSYRLHRPFEWLAEDRVYALLTPPARHVFTLSFVDEVSSSNTVLQALPEQARSSGLVLGAEWQHACRGRMHKTWQVALGGSLTFSVLWHFANKPLALSGVTLAAGIAVIRALHQLQVPAQLKWPNDIVLCQGKLGGILVEAIHQHAQGTWGVIGMGLNIGDAPNRPATAVYCTIASRNILLAYILNALEAVLTVLATQGFQCLQKEWEKACVHLDLPVQLLVPNGQIMQGIAQGVNEQGALLLKTDQGVHPYHVGDISLIMMP
ncbi:MAG: biotin--[acetyl-CoA-carboxylase] ligase [Neisseriales bacterium]|nr:MAG: biotin--[acetyl-CoA-carboxylase] ligase [Neisseriales bacterium]